MGKAIDMTGQITQYGVYIIERDFSNTHEAHWRCKCPICKREDWIVKGSRLRGENQIKMCKICSAKNNLKSIQQPYFKDIAGQRFGKLLALERTEEKHKTCYIWKCLCDCGNICYKSGEYLRNGDTQSCGCIVKSKGEEKIENLLNAAKIQFEREKTFKDFVFSTGKHPRFDFAIYNNGYLSYLIEFDGRQHFIQEDNGYGAELEKIIERDNIKDMWCKNNNIPLIRIPYTHLNKLTLCDLLLESTTFKI